MTNHLGGHGNTTHLDLQTLLYLKDKYDIKTMVDIGCGPGGMVTAAETMGIVALGIDGDSIVEPQVLHDFTKGMAELPESFDLGWSVEFLEHVDEQYMDNYMDVFQRCKYVVCTAAPPGKSGHHHVNCQTTKYWIRKFYDYGLHYDSEETDYIREHSSMTREFMRNYGMFYRR